MIRAFVAILSAIALHASDASTRVQVLTRQQAADAVDAILFYRLNVLEDGTVVNFCGVDDFWDTDGNLIADERARKYARFKVRADCSKSDSRDSRYSTVIVKGIELLKGDRVAIYSQTRRGDTLLHESYEFTGVSTPHLQRLEYVVYAIAQS